MHFFTSNQPENRLSPHSSRDETAIWLGCSGIMLVCTGLICLNFRARLLNRTTWKEKQQQQQQNDTEQSPAEQKKHHHYHHQQQQKSQLTDRPLPPPNPAQTDCRLVYPEL
ncbi:unnamed protein product [Echinostoma caproni]|uniref:SURF1-like protein n=1 Tax=Echinostoma caproni TaxID=27848 RepID=A0A183A644_9TREM|nr:unnamed protein product [Echinostoma caproni]